MDSKTSIGWLLKTSTDVCTDFKIKKKFLCSDTQAWDAQKDNAAKCQSFITLQNGQGTNEGKVVAFYFLNTCLLMKGSRVITLLSLFILKNVLFFTL